MGGLIGSSAVSYNHAICVPINKLMSICSRGGACRRWNEVSYREVEFCEEGRRGVGPEGEAVLVVGPESQAREGSRELVWLTRRERAGERGPPMP